MVDNTETNNGTEAESPLKMSARRRLVVTLGVTTGVFIAALETTVVGTAMPTVIASLGGLNHYSWVFSAYLLASTVTAPVWGKLSDLYGRRLFYQIGIALFLLGSVLSGLSTSMPQLIASRALQGLGAGALVPLGMTIIASIYTLRERARMQAFFSGAWGLASVIGPVVGGFLTEQLSWRWVFYINIPFGLIAAAIIGVALHDPPRTKRPVIDYAGAATLTVAITLLMLGLVEGGTNIARLTSGRNLALLVGAGVLLAVFTWIERRAVEPVVPLELFANRMVTVSTIATFLAGFAMFGAISFVPLFAQGVMGATATEAGSLLTPLLLGWVMFSIIGGRLLLKMGYRPTVIAGFTLLAIGSAILTIFGRGTTRTWLVVDMFLIGAGLGLTMLTLIIAVQHAVPRAQLGVATSLNQFARSIGGAVGVAIMGAVLSAGLTANSSQVARSGTSQLAPTRVAELAEHPNVLVEPASRAALPADILKMLENVLAAALRNVFRIGAVFAGLGLVAVFWLPKGSGEHKVDAPPREAWSVETGERMMITGMTTIDAQHEPVALSADHEM